jgi:hypothetical protein
VRRFLHMIHTIVKETEIKSLAGLTLLTEVVALHA